MSYEVTMDKVSIFVARSGTCLPKLAEILLRLVGQAPTQANDLAHGVAFEASSGRSARTSVCVGADSVNGLPWANVLNFSDSMRVGSADLPQPLSAWLPSCLQA